MADEDPRQRFQGKCLVSTEGWEWMKSNYDKMPPTVRAVLASSEFNICAACVSQEAGMLAASRNSNLVTEDDYIGAIRTIERQIRNERPQN